MNLDSVAETGKMVHIFGQPALIGACGWLFSRYIKRITPRETAMVCSVQGVATLAFSPHLLSPIPTTVEDEMIQFFGRIIVSSVLIVALDRRIDIDEVITLNGVCFVSLYAMHSLAVWFFKRAATQELSQGIEVTHEMEEDLRKVLRGDESCREITKKVFTLEKYPGFYFKKVKPKTADKLIQHKCICSLYSFTELFIPQSKIVVIDGETIIVQQKVDFIDHDTRQEELYQRHAEQLTLAIEQLREYILVTHEGDVEWRNMPIKEPTFQIILLDHELSESAEWGILGCTKYKRRGLIGLLGEKEAREMALWARRHFNRTAVDEALDRRLQELSHT